jgi:hypothetical protein
LALRHLQNFSKQRPKSSVNGNEVRQTDYPYGNSHLEESLYGSHRHEQKQNCQLKIRRAQKQVFSFFSFKNINQTANF